MRGQLEGNKAPSVRERAAVFKRALAIPRGSRKVRLLNVWPAKSRFFSFFFWYMGGEGRPQYYISSTVKGCLYFLFIVTQACEYNFTNYRIL